MSAITTRTPLESIDLTRHYTYDELSDLLGETHRPMDLVHGQLIVHDQPTVLHQEILGNLYLAFRAFVASRQLGRVLLPADMVLASDLCLQPDLIFTAPEHCHRLQKHVEGPADLVVEILSPGNRHHDLVVKRSCYEDFGVKEYWIVDPQKWRVDILTLGPDRKYRLAGRYGMAETASSQLLSGFQIPVAEIFT